MEDLYQGQMIETLRELTLQLLLISAGVFGIVGGFISSSNKTYQSRGWLVFALGAFALSALSGYVIHGALISLLGAGRFDPYHPLVQWGGLFQIGLFVVGGVAFIWFIVRNTGGGNNA